MIILLLNISMFMNAHFLEFDRFFGYMTVILKVINVS